MPSSVKQSPKQAHDHWLHRVHNCPLSALLVQSGPSELRDQTPQSPGHLIFPRNGRCLGNVQMLLSIAVDQNQRHREGHDSYLPETFISLHLQELKDDPDSERGIAPNWGRLES